MTDTLTLTELDEMLDHALPCGWPESAHYYTMYGVDYDVPCTHEVTHRIGLDCVNQSRFACDSIVQIYRHMVSLGGACRSCQRDIQDCWRLMPV